MKRSCAVAAVALFWTALGFHAPARLPLLRAGGASPGGRASALRRPAGSRRGVTLRRQLSEETCEEMARREDVESRTLTPSKMARARAPPPRDGAPPRSKLRPPPQAFAFGALALVFLVAEVASQGADATLAMATSSRVGPRRARACEYRRRASP